MNRNLIETLTGVLVLGTAGVFLLFAYQSSGMGISTKDGYTVSARFANATGINTGSDVRIGGIKIGIVSDMKLDPETYEAQAILRIAGNTPIPADSSAAIASSGLLGDKFVQISPGGDEEMLKEGGRIGFTQSSVSLEELIGKFVFSGGGVDKKQEAPAPTPAP